MSPNSTVEVVNASSALIDNTNGYIGGMTLDNYPIKTIKSWRIKAGTPAGELLNMNLRNIGETDSGKVISAHVKFVLDYATNDSPVANAEGSINVVKDGLLHMYWMPKSDNSADKQGGHYEIQFYDDDTGRPIKLALTIDEIEEFIKFGYILLIKKRIDVNTEISYNFNQKPYIIKEYHFGVKI